MVVFEMIVAIVFILAVTTVIIVKNLSGNRSSPVTGDVLKRMSDLEDRLGAMETRLQNVETITTSKSFQLDREFESLKKEA